VTLRYRFTISSTIAPTLVINYDDKSWQALLSQLGEITGQEKQAAARIAEFDKQMADVKARIKLPPQPVNALVYTAGGAVRICGPPSPPRASFCNNWVLRSHRCRKDCRRCKARVNATTSCNWAVKIWRPV
jgi:ABC-type Fe2+-enterobactin transport system substrate-binding protein